MRAGWNRCPEIRRDLWQTAGVPYFFDGNNLIGLTAAQARVDRETRRDFLKLLSGFATTRGGQYTVFFDGDDPDRSVPPRGVKVRYSAPLSADEAILRWLEGQQRPDEFIVVTNDAGLRSRSGNLGARTMDWAEFTAAMGKGPPARMRRGRREDPVDVKDWARYFGIDDDLLD